MDVQAKTCPSCGGSGHDKGGMPVVKRVKFDPYKHNAYIDGDQDQHRYHETIKRGSGCMNCGGVGFIEMEAS